MRNLLKKLIGIFLLFLSQHVSVASRLCVTKIAAAEKQNITQLFVGKAEVTILAPDAHSRLAHIRDSAIPTHSILAATIFSPEATSALRGAHEKILTGISIGESFRSLGYRVTRKKIDTFSMQLPAQRMRSLNGFSNPAQVNVVELWVEKDGKSFLYGRIGEIYSDAFKPSANSFDDQPTHFDEAWRSELQKIFAR